MANNPTHDLFQMEAAFSTLNGQTVRVNKVQDSVCYSPIYDTALITQIFLQRPINIAAYSLGQWFAAAHKTAIPKEVSLQLSRCASSLETKLLIVQLGLNSLPLVTLTDFNEAMIRKGTKTP